MSGSLTAEQLARVAELERLMAEHGLPAAELAELKHLRDLARSLTGPAEVADDPRTPFTDEARRPLIHGTDDPSTPEDESDYLGAQLARSRLEREAAIKAAALKLLDLLEPAALAFLKGALDRGVAGLNLPPALAPFVSVVEAAAMDAAGQVVKDVTG